MSPTFAGIVLVSLLSAPASAAAKSSGAAQAGQPAARSSRVSGDARARLVAAARRHVDKPFRGDCSGFVRRVYAEAGVRLPPSTKARSGTEAIVRGLGATRRPRPGDVAYFHRTHDRDPPGPGRNLFTHVGLVESVDGPRVSVIHRSNTGVERLRIHLARPADPEVNEPLRRRKPTDSPKQQYLAGQLLAGFASPFRGAPGPAAARVERQARRAPQPPPRSARPHEPAPARNRPDGS